VDTILYFGLTNAVLATVFALAAWLVRRRERWPAVAHSLWLLVLLKLVTPPLIQITVPWLAAWDMKPGASLGDDEFLEFAAYLPNDAAAAADRSGGANHKTLGASGKNRGSSGTGTPLGLSALLGLAYWKTTLVLVWIVGAVSFWSVALIRIGQMRLLIRDAQPASPALQAEVERLARRLCVAHPPCVWLSPLPIAPMLWALLRKPQLLLPRALWERLQADQRTTLLVHELAHLRNGDHWVRRLELITLGLYWWHPVAWWARRELLDAQEQRCDDVVVMELPDSAAAYAQTLLDTVAFLSRRRSLAPLGASGMGQVRILKRRFAMILEGSTARKWSRSWAWLMLGFGAMLLPLLPTRAQSPGQDNTSKPAGKTVPAGVPSNSAIIHSAEYELIRAMTSELGAKPTPAQARPVDDRLENLEKRVEELLKEIQAMRREGVAPAATEKARGKLSAIDLQPWANERLDAPSFHSGQYKDNNLAPLPTGDRKLGGVPFKIGEELIQLGTSIGKPEKVENIKVGRQLSRLYILQATAYIADDGVEIAKYTIHYEDGTTTTIPVVYGEDVLDWWKYSFCGEPTRGKVVWNGENEPAKREFDATIRLYMTTWQNPKPDVRISRIDYAVTGETPCMPFCVAMTAESK
jgi:beta-lactamase regulating signal transducer with metallopeptidase domain